MSLLFERYEDEPLPSDKPKIAWSQLKTAEDKVVKLATELRETTNTKARAYLASTDWYLIRKAEAGVEVPVDILEARQAARDTIL